MIKGVTLADLGPIWYLTEPSDVPYSPNQFLGWAFFPQFLQQTGSSYLFVKQGTSEVQSRMEGASAQFLTWIFNFQKYGQLRAAAVCVPSHAVM